MISSGVVFALVFLGLAGGLAALTIDHGFHPTDDGWILAFAWRIVNGEVPYRDFIFERTPLSPYIATILLSFPEGSQLQAGRVLFYLELALSGLLPTLWAVRRCGLRPGARTVALISAGFLLSAHNFPPMPWTTVDGLFLGSVGLTAFLFSLGSSGARMVAFTAGSSLAFALAMLAKQSYAVLFAALILYALVEARRQRAGGRLSAVLLPGLLAGVVTIGLLAANDALHAFGQQIAAAGGVRELAVAGVLFYGRSLVFGLGFLAFAVGFAGASATGQDPTRSISLVRASRAMVPVVMAGAALWPLLSDYGIARVIETGHAVFWLVVGAVLGRLLSDVRQGTVDQGRTMLSFGVLLIAWCSSLSFAYRTPLLGLAAVGLALEFSLPPPHARVERNLAVGSALIVAAAIASLIVVHPYRDLPRRDQIADLGTIYPRFGQLFTNPANYERLKELKSLSAALATQAGRSFVVLPEYPIIYFIAGVRNPLSVDWSLDQEYRGNEDRLIRELETEKPIALVEREDTPVGAPAEPPRPCGREPGSAYSALVRHVTSHWDLIATGTYFCVYRSPATQ